MKLKIDPKVVVSRKVHLKDCGENTNNSDLGLSINIIVESLIIKDIILSPAQGVTPNSDLLYDIDRVEIKSEETDTLFARFIFLSKPFENAQAGDKVWLVAPFSTENYQEGDDFWAFHIEATISEL